MEHKLDITITFSEDRTSFITTVLEPESGLYTEFESPFSPDEHPAFNDDIGNEIYSWLTLWEETEREEDDDDIDPEDFDDEDDWDCEDEDDEDYTE